MDKHQTQKVSEASPETGEAFVEFCKTIAKLRSEDGCPWDKVQTHESVASALTEEAAEAVEAIENFDVDHLREELGDVLLQVVFQSQIASEESEFDIQDVIADVQAKMIRRHPHVFGAEKSLIAAGFSEEEIAFATTPGNVLDMWQHIKEHERILKENARRKKAIEAGLEPDAPAGILDDVPYATPALLQAKKISKRLVSVGFEWDEPSEVWEQVEEEINEFNQAQSDEDRIEEFGDILFTLVNYARKYHIDAEDALLKTCKKIRNRWTLVEKYAYEFDKKDVSGLSRDRLEELWQQAKADLRNEARA